MSAMTTRQAAAEAKRRFGVTGIARLTRRVTWREADRVRARGELKQLRENKPVRPNWAKADDDMKRAYWAAFREFRKSEEQLMTIVLSHRCDVGSIMPYLGAFHVRGSGDTFEEAFAEVDRKERA